MNENRTVFEFEANGGNFVQVTEQLAKALATVTAAARGVGTATAEGLSAVAAAQQKLDAFYHSYSVSQDQLRKATEAITTPPSIRATTDELTKQETEFVRLRVAVQDYQRVIAVLNGTAPMSVAAGRPVAPATAAGATSVTELTAREAAVQRLATVTAQLAAAEDLYNKRVAAYEGGPTRNRATKAQEAQTSLRSLQTQARDAASFAAAFEPPPPGAEQMTVPPPPPIFDPRRRSGNRQGAYVDPLTGRIISEADAVAQTGRAPGPEAGAPAAPDSFWGSLLPDPTAIPRPEPSAPAPPDSFWDALLPETQRRGGGGPPPPSLADLSQRLRESVVGPAPVADPFAGIPAPRVSAAPATPAVGQQYQMNVSAPPPAPFLGGAGPTRLPAPVAPWPAANPAALAGLGGAGSGGGGIGGARGAFLSDVAAEVSRVTAAMVPLEQRLAALRADLGQAAPSTLTDTLERQVKDAERALESLGTKSDVGARRLTDSPPKTPAGLKTAQRGLDSLVDTDSNALNRLDTQISATQQKIADLLVPPSARADFVTTVTTQIRTLDSGFQRVDTELNGLRGVLATAAPSTLTDTLNRQLTNAQNALGAAAGRNQLAGRRLTDTPPSTVGQLDSGQRSLDANTNSQLTAMTRLDALVTALRPKIATLLQSNVQASFIPAMDAGLQTLEARMVGLQQRVVELRPVLNQLPAGNTFDALNRQVTALEASIARMALSATKSMTALRVPPTTQAEAQRLAAAFQQLDASTNIAAGAAGVKLDQLAAKLRDLTAPSAQAEAALAKVDKELRQKPDDANKAGEAFSKFWSRAGSVATGFLITDVLNKVSNALGAVAGSLVNSPGQFQTYSASLTQIMGSASAAKAELSQVTSEAVFAPQTIEQVVTMDEKLQALIGTTDGVHTAFGASMSDVRKAILDTSATFPALDPNVLAKDFKIMQERPAIALRSLETMGVVTRDQLKAQGVQFDQFNKTVLSNYTVNANALLKVLQQQYGGMAAVQAGTFEGMKSNLGDFMTRATAILGKDVFAVINQRLHDLLVLIQTPQFQATLEDWGVKLGKLMNAAMITFDAIVSGIKNVLNWLRPVTDALGLFIDALPSPQKAIDFASAQEAALARIQKAQANAAQSTQDVAQAQADATNGITKMDRANEDLRYNYGLQIQKLQDLATQMDRTFNTDKAVASQDLLRKKIAQDTALAKDVYSSEGRAAAERLPAEQAQLADDIAQQAHDNAKANNADAITDLEKKRDKLIRDNDLTKRGYEDTLTAIRDAQAQTDQLGDATGRTTGKIVDEGKAGQTAGQNIAAALQVTLQPLADAAAAIKTIQAVLGTLGGAIATFAAGVADPLVSNWNAWIETIKKTPDPLKSISDALDDVKAHLGGNFPDLLKTWGTGIGNTFALAATVVGIVGQAIVGSLIDIGIQIRTAGQQWQGLQDILHGQNPADDPWIKDMEKANEADRQKQVQVVKNMGTLAGDWLGTWLKGLGFAPSQNLPPPGGDTQLVPAGAPPPAAPGAGAGGQTPAQYYNNQLYGAPLVPQSTSGANQQFLNTPSWANTQTINLNLQLTDAQGTEWFRRMLTLNGRFVDQVVAGQVMGHK